MAQILIGQFDDFASARLAADEVRAGGTAADDVEEFDLNAPGQHDRHPLGGDEDADAAARPGSGGAVVGAVAGGAAGLVASLAALPVGGPLGIAAGTAVGAYIGSLAGAVGSMGQDDPATAATTRPAGVRVAVRTLTDADRPRIVAAFRRHEVRSIEVAEGTWQQGAWANFDPISAPIWIQAPVS